MLHKTHQIAWNILNWMLIAVVGFLVLDVLLGVFSRYIFGSQVLWTEELSVVLLIWLSFLGIAAAFAGRVHLGLDILTNALDSSVKRNVTAIGHVITMLFVLIVFVVGGIGEVVDSITYLNLLPTLQVPDTIRVVPLPLSGFFILLFESYNLKQDLCAKEEYHD